MFVECPHCYNRVMPTANNICPACRKDISDTRGVDPNLTALDVHESSNLPPYCYSCNSPTKRYANIIEKVEIGGDTPLARFLLVLISILTLRVAISNLQTQGKKSSVSIYIPQCERCAQLGKPKPKHVDFEQRAMTFIVHKGFRDRVH